MVGSTILPDCKWQVYSNDEGSADTMQVLTKSVGSTACQPYPAGMRSDTLTCDSTAAAKQAAVQLSSSKYNITTPDRRQIGPDDTLLSGHLYFQPPATPDAALSGACYILALALMYERTDDELPAQPYGVIAQTALNGVVTDLGNIGTDMIESLTVEGVEYYIDRTIINSNNFADVAEVVGSIGLMRSRHCSLRLSRASFGMARVR